MKWRALRVTVCKIIRYFVRSKILKASVQRRAKRCGSAVFVSIEYEAAAAGSRSAPLGVRTTSYYQVTALKV
jgi:hypothetical protein